MYTSVAAVVAYLYLLLSKPFLSFALTYIFKVEGLLLDELKPAYVE